MSTKEKSILFDRKYFPIIISSQFFLLIFYIYLFQNFSSSSYSSIPPLAAILTGGIFIVIFIQICQYVLKVDNNALFLFSFIYKFTALIVLNLFFSNLFLLFPLFFADFLISLESKNGYLAVLLLSLFFSNFMNQQQMLNREYLEYISSLNFDDSIAAITSYLKGFTFSIQNIFSKLSVLITSALLLFFNKSRIITVPQNNQLSENRDDYIESLEMRIQELQNELIQVGNDYKTTLKSITHDNEDIFGAFEEQLKLSFKKIFREYYIHKRESNSLILIRRIIALGTEEIVKKRMDGDIDINSRYLNLFQSIINKPGDSVLFINGKEELYNLVSNTLSNKCIMLKMVVGDSKEEYYISLFFSLTIYDIETEIAETLNTMTSILKNKLVIHNELENKSKKIDLLYQKAYVDVLTGIFRREKYAEYEESLFQNELKNVAVITFDMDYFKKINDTYGHIAGDMVLKKMGTLLSQNVKKGRDLPIRYGGDEFIVIVQCSLDEDVNQVAFNIAERIRKSIESENFESEQGDNFKATTTIGIFGARNDIGLSFQEFHKRSDEALYVSKKLGKNKTTIWNTVYE